MNKGYTYVDGKCIITDEKGDKRLEEYTDKTDEILICENVIETLENELDITKEELIKQIKKEKRIKSDIWFNTLLLVLPLITAQLAFRLLAGPNAFEVMFGTHPLVMNFVKGFFIFIGVTFGGTGYLSTYFNKKENKKTIDGLTSKEKAIEKSLQEEKEYLEELNSQKTKQELPESFCDKKIDDLETLKKLRSYIELYYDCGYNKEKYLRYLQENKLNKKLSKYYTEEGLNLVEEYLEEEKQLKLAK